MWIFPTRGSKATSVSRKTPAPGTFKSSGPGKGVPASPADVQEQMVRELVEQQLELLGLGARAAVSPGSEESLLDRVGQLEARLERAEALLQDAVPNAWRRSPRQQKSTSFISSPATPPHVHMEGSPSVMKEALFASRSRSPRDTQVALFTARGGPAVVETFLKDGSWFRTLEPPEMEFTPRTLVVGLRSPRAPGAHLMGGPVMGCVVTQPRAGEEEPPCEEGPSSRPVLPRLTLPPSSPPSQKLRSELQGPKWGAPLEVFGDEASSLGDSTRDHIEDIPSPEGKHRAPPWFREPDEGTVEDNTAAWLWQVDLPGGDEELGVEVHCRDDVDRLVVTSVREGRVARWNSEKPRHALRVEIGDTVVGVGTCEGSTAELLEHLGQDRTRKIQTLKLRRDMQNWYRLKLTAMGYVEQPGRRLPGKTF